MKHAIEVSNLNKVYKLFNDSKERMYNLFFPGKYGEDFYALKNIDFIANQGEVVGFIGINGSGKSTLSNIISGIVPETDGRVLVNGETALIAVSAGLKNDLSGRDNIELKLLMLGFNKEEIKKLENDIIEFSELEKFIDQPVKSYSSGMKSRLGFAISVNVDPNILIIDEALSVGDKAFAEKSLNKMFEFKEKGKTMIFVSHSLGQMKQFCDKILWLEFGEVRDYGDVEEIIPKYEFFLEEWRKMNKEDKDKYKKMSVQKRKEVIKSKTLKQKAKNIDITNSLKNARKIQPTSLICRLKNNNIFLLNETQNKEDYLKYTLFAKRETVVSGSKYFLLSFEQSGIEKTIGWVNEDDIKKYNYVFVDNDKKTLKLNGTGQAFNIPWGNAFNLMIDNLENYKDSTFIVNETVLVGRNIWYKGDIDNTNLKNVWLHENFTKDSKEL